MSVIPESRIEDPLLNWKWRCVKDTRNNSKKVEVELGWDGLGVEPGWGETPTYKSQISNANEHMYADMCTRVRFEVNTLPMLK